MTSPFGSKALANMLPGELSRIEVLDGCARSALPDWAASLICLGAWCRACQSAGERLIVFAVLPTRELAAAFAGIGCVIAGASAFQDTLSWPTFARLPLGQSVFWTHRGTMESYYGEIIQFRESEGSDFIVVRVTKAPKRKNIGAIMHINRRYFDEYQFSENKPLSALRSASFDAAWQSLESLVENLNPKWIWADRAEGLIVTNLASLESSIATLSLSIDAKPPISVSNLLCMGRNKEKEHAKLRVDHPRGSLEGEFPLVILDGLSAFMVHEHLAESTNMLIILDRTEYNASVHDTAVSLASISRDLIGDFLGLIPDKFSPGIQLAGYVIAKG